MTDADTFITGLVNIDGDPEGAVLAQYDPDQRWNGWLCPAFDLYTVIEFIDRSNAHVGDPEDDSYLHYRFEGDALLVAFPVYLAEDPDNAWERVEPDSDGLYWLGAWGWCWSEAAQS